MNTFHFLHLKIILQHQFLNFTVQFVNIPVTDPEQGVVTSNSQQL
jgi:hypothetical protein